jgi:hypothetical protein
MVALGVLVQGAAHAQQTRQTTRTTVTQQAGKPPVVSTTRSTTVTRPRTGAVVGGAVLGAAAVGAGVAIARGREAGTAAPPAPQAAAPPLNPVNGRPSIPGLSHAAAAQLDRPTEPPTLVARVEHARQISDATRCDLRDQPWETHALQGLLHGVSPLAQTPAAILNIALEASGSGYHRAAPEAETCATIAQSDGVRFGDATQAYHQAKLECEQAGRGNCPLNPVTGSRPILGSQTDTGQWMQYLAWTYITQAGTRPFSTTPTPPTNLTGIIEEARAAYTAGRGNELAQSAAMQRMRDRICADLPLTVWGWRARLASIATKDQILDVRVELPGNIILRSTPQPHGELAAGLFPHTPDAAAQLAQLRPGTEIVVGGTFIPHAETCFRELSITEAGRIRRPEFLFRFLTITR